MDYINIDISKQREGYSNRVAQLEVEHFTNTILLFEAEITDSLGSEEAVELKERNEVLEKRINALRVKVAELSELLGNSEEENESN